MLQCYGLILVIILVSTVDRNLETSNLVYILNLFEQIVYIISLPQHLAFCPLH